MEGHGTEVAQNKFFREDGKMDAWQIKFQLELQEKPNGEEKFSYSNEKCFLCNEKTLRRRQKIEILEERINVHGCSIRTLQLMNAPIKALSAPQKREEYTVSSHLLDITFKFMPECLEAKNITYTGVLERF